MKLHLLSLQTLVFLAVSGEAQNHSETSPYAPIYAECPSELAVRPASDVCTIFRPVTLRSKGLTIVGTFERREIVAGITKQASYSRPQNISRPRVHQRL